MRAARRGATLSGTLFLQTEEGFRWASFWT